MFMIFGNHAINMDLVTRLDQLPQPENSATNSVRIHTTDDSLVVVGVTIDQILTAQAAGQSRVQQPEKGIYPPLPLDQIAQAAERAATYNGLNEWNAAQPPDWSAREIRRHATMDYTGHFDDGSKRGQSTGNDPQAMKSIGRK